MSHKTLLFPPEAAKALFLPDSAYMARTDLRQTRMLGYSAFNADSVTALLTGVLGAQPTVRHRAGATDAILRIFEHAGLPIDEDIRFYETAEEAERQADRLIGEGFACSAPIR